ncbi:RagB/SusD family nutrient uptake outer membrane protein [Sphingobacterium sp. LRF_L2]|uniref:RagB/SusD family nutrient uptake outer membrane protein n=1 Tax=Sphingobacterium sp. LRF_L2 TaxID=3369421 RepID=UPI003F5D9E5F
MFLGIFGACSGFLDEKPDASLSEASTLADLEAIFDYTAAMNRYTMGLGEASADNYYLESSTWESLDQHERSLYAWDGEIFYDTYLNAWLDYYQTVYNANYVLGRLEKLDASTEDRTRFNDIKGRALFFRALAFYKLVTLFAQSYDPATADTDPGIPLRLSDDFNIPSTRASVAACYVQIISDALSAAQLLPVLQDNSYTPSRNAAYILLSWAYLLTEDFVNCEKYAKESLTLNDQILDYSKFDAGVSYPFQLNNAEVVFTLRSANLSLLYYYNAKIDSTLYASYGTGDLRKSLFFKSNSDGSVYFRGSYIGSFSLFMGFASTDAYLNLTEALFRQGKITEGLTYLDRLLKNRYMDYEGTLNASLSSGAALDLLLDERRKEMLMRDSRWADIKRLNRMDGRGIVVKRILGDQVLELLPNDNRYALPFPQEVIQASGMTQNPR